MAKMAVSELLESTKLISRIISDLSDTKILNKSSFLLTNFLKLNEKRHKINVKTSKYHRCECLETQMKTDWTLKIENSREQKIRNQKIRRRHQKLDLKEQVL